MQQRGEILGLNQSKELGSWFFRCLQAAMAVDSDDTNI